ncbi:MAG TPA: hypothetical protein VGG03_23600 [Thermoanaerobaculia bacterium]|jgi:hypothetical protein
MKSIQVQFNEDLQDREASAAIAEQYRKAYERGAGLDRDFEGWEDQGS